MNCFKFLAPATAFLLCVALCGAADRDDTAQARSRLAAVRARIAALSARLGEDLKQKDALGARLREAEVDMASSRQRLESLRGEQVALDARRADLKREQERGERQLAVERAALAAQVRAAYLIGSQEKFKLLLSQSDPASVGRTLDYYGYFARERSAHIATIGAEAEHLRSVAAEQADAAAKLDELRTRTSQQVKELEQARAARGDALAAVNARVADGNQQLQALKREEQAVESLVADLSRVLKDFPVDAEQSFDSLRGRLPWPVQGRIVARYQEARGAAAQSAVRWNGVLIEAPRGSKVRSPYFGRVIYADWLQGIGLLLIIGHSGRYMTLYGHAEVLYKSVGDWVSPGDVIAALPDAGSEPRLYFEIRDGRKTVDPSAWLKSASATSR